MLSTTVATSYMRQYSIGNVASETKEQNLLYLILSKFKLPQAASGYQIGQCSSRPCYHSHYYYYYYYQH